MSAQIASPSSLPELPPEIWLKIFQIATFIPFERDLPATTFESGLFCSYDTYQISAFERVLPLRLSIVLVSRRFYQIGAEVLYTAFHANARLNDCDPKLSLFSDLLVPVQSWDALSGDSVCGGQIGMKRTTTESLADVPT